MSAGVRILMINSEVHVILTLMVDYVKLRDEILSVKQYVFHSMIGPRGNAGNSNRGDRQIVQR